MGLINAFYQSTVMVSNGASWGQAIAVSGFSLLIGKGTEQIVKAEDGSLVSSLITGGASGVANKAFSSAVMGRSISGLDLLESAAQGAAQSAVAWGMGPSSNVTKASAESAQGGRDKDWGIPPDAASRRGIVRRWISVSDDKGGTRGYIGVVEYRDQTGGLVIELVYKSQAGSPDDLNWVQTVDTSRDRKTGLSSHFIDNGGGGGTNYYMSPARAVKEHGFRGFDAHFWDDPQRTNLEGVPRPNVRWEAELSLVSTRNHSVLMTLTYGFSTDVLGRATVMPLVPAQPSNFQKGAVP